MTSSPQDVPSTLGRARGLLLEAQAEVRGHLASQVSHGEDPEAFLQAALSMTDAALHLLSDPLAQEALAKERSACD